MTGTLLCRAKLINEWIVLFICMDAKKLFLISCKRNSRAFERSCFLYRFGFTDAYYENVSAYNIFIGVPSGHEGPGPSPLFWLGTVVRFAQNRWEIFRGRVGIIRVIGTEFKNVSGTPWRPCSCTLENIDVLPSLPKPRVGYIGSFQSL